MRAITRALTFCLALGLLVASPAALLAATPQEKAAQRYERGVEQRDKATQLEKLLASAADPQEQAKLTKELARAHKKAVKEFRAATTKDPQLVAAFNAMAELLTRTGQPTEAVKAYERSLALRPDDLSTAQAKAEALLAADRPAEARRDYESIAARDSDRAAELFLAMKHWVVSRRTDRAGLSADSLRDFERWILQQEAKSGNFDLE